MLIPCVCHYLEVNCLPCVKGIKDSPKFKDCHSQSLQWGECGYPAVITWGVSFLPRIFEHASILAGFPIHTMFLEHETWYTNYNTYPHHTAPPRAPSTPHPHPHPTPPRFFIIAVITKQESGQGTYPIKPRKAGVLLNPLRLLRIATLAVGHREFA